MGHEELDEHDIPLKLAARALGVSPRTLLDWLSNGDIKGEQTTNDRWWLKVSDCREFIRNKRGPGSRAEAMFDAVLMTGELPPSPFKLPEVKPDAKAMICS